MKNLINTLSFLIGFVLALLLLLPYSARANDDYETQTIKTIDNYCFKLWEPDYKFINECVSEQVEYHNKYAKLLQTLYPILKNSKELHNICKYAYELWYPDYKFIYEETRKQIKEFLDFAENNK